MRRPCLALLVLTVSAPAPAAERRLFLSSFTRLRVEGGVRVTVTGGGSPAGTVAEDDDAPDAVEVRQNGDTLTVRRPLARASGTPPNAGGPVAVTLSTPALTAVSVVGAGAVAVAGMKGDRVDLSVAGTGEIAVVGAEATDLVATSIGDGRITVAGRAARVRLVGNGAGSIKADGLDAAELSVRLDGPGEATGRARYTATVTNVGLGRVTIAGSPRCTVQSVAGGPVTCGTAAPAR